jgi:hypothetical protein
VLFYAAANFSFYFQNHFAVVVQLVVASYSQFSSELYAAFLLMVTFHIQGVEVDTAYGVLMDPLLVFQGVGVRLDKGH